MTSSSSGRDRRRVRRCPARRTGSIGRAGRGRGDLGIPHDRAIGGAVPRELRQRRSTQAHPCVESITAPLPRPQTGAHGQQPRKHSRPRLSTPRRLSRQPSSSMATEHGKSCRSCGPRLPGRCGNPTPRTSTSPATTRAMSSAAPRRHDPHRLRCVHLNARTGRGGSRPATTALQRRSVNAAGAWGDRIGELAGAQPLGLHPLRRTIAIAAIPEHFDADEVRRWPITAFQPDDRSGMIGYCKPEPGGLLVSPADETPSEPCGAKPEEHDVALGLHNLAAFTTLEVRHVRSTWAGLRTFTSDRHPPVASTWTLRASTGWSAKAATAFTPLMPSPKPPQRTSAIRPGPIDWSNWGWRRLMWRRTALVSTDH